MTTETCIDTSTRSSGATWIVFYAFCLLTVALSSQALGGMGVSPIKQEITVKPGETAKVKVIVSNAKTDEHVDTESMDIELADVEATEEGTLLFPPPGSVADGGAKWMRLDKTEMTLKPQESEPIQITISLPLDTPPGEYYAGLMITTRVRPSRDMGVAVRFRTVSGILLTVPGRTFPKQAKIERCEFVWPDPATATRPVDPKLTPAQQALRLPRVSILVNNTGRVRFKGSGKVTLQDATNREVFSGPLKSLRDIVYGGDKRIFETPIDKPLPAGRYTLRIDFDYESAWGKARDRKMIEILPEQAAAMVSMTRTYSEGQPPIEVTPATLAMMLRPGATRSLALAVKNLKTATVRGTASVRASNVTPADKWITLSPGDLTISKAGQKTVAVRVQVPAGTAGGTYTSAVILKVGSEESPLLERVVPVLIEVQAEK